MPPVKLPRSAHKGEASVPNIFSPDLSPLQTVKPLFSGPASHAVWGWVRDGRIGGDTDANPSVDASNLRRL
jgi:hypothetical protein